MRRIAEELKTMPGAVRSYEDGRRAFVDGVSYSALPIGRARAGYIDALADALADVCMCLGIDQERFALPREPFTFEGVGNVRVDTATTNAGNGGRRGH